MLKARRCLIRSSDLGMVSPDQHVCRVFTAVALTLCTDDHLIHELERLGTERTSTTRRCQGLVDSVEVSSVPCFDDVIGGGARM